MRTTARPAIAAALLSLVILVGNAIARDEVYVAYGADGTPSFSTQPYDTTYAIYLRDAASAPQPKRFPHQASAGDRRARLSPLIAKTAREHGVDPALISAIADIESGFNPNAVSPKGAIGAMQLVPRTATQYGVIDARDVQQNLTGGTRLLKDLLTTYHGNLSLALAAYNAGQGNVLRHNQRIPPFAETMLYVPRVLAKMEEYQRRNEAPPQ